MVFKQVRDGPDAAVYQPFLALFKTFCELHWHAPPTPRHEPAPVSATEASAGQEQVRARHHSTGPESQALQRASVAEKTILSDSPLTRTIARRRLRPGHWHLEADGEYLGSLFHDEGAGLWKAYRPNQVPVGEVAADTRNFARPIEEIADKREWREALSIEGGPYCYTDLERDIPF